VILIDSNILLYACDSLAPSHARARAWLEDAVAGDDQIGLPLLSILAFLRLATNPSVFKVALDSAVAIGVIESWLSRPNVSIVVPSERHWRVLSEVAAAGQARGPQLMDAHLAALAIEHGATLMTTDRGFARFPGLRFRNPVAT